MATAPFKVKAVYDYSSPHEDDLNFGNGQIITVTEEEDADWYIGEYTDDSGSKHSGLFPKNFVERYEPAIPSRPARAARPVSQAVSMPPPPPPSEPQAAEESDDEEEQGEAPGAAQEATTQAKPVPLPVAPTETAAPVPAPAPAPAPAPKAPSTSSVASPITSPKAGQAPQTIPPAEKPAAPKPTPASTPASAPAPAPVASSTRGPPPPVSEKPSSFRDRIAAFNKAAAAEAPIAPIKPTGAPASFIKKPFVAPPPSKNAYVPPPRAEPVQKMYRREEDPEIAEKQAQDEADAARAGLLPSDPAGGPAAAEGHGGEAEEAPKPQSLKERIAMLQRQQMEQAQRRADAVSHKEKPKKPPVKKRTDDPPPVPAVPEDGGEGARPTRESLDRTRDRSVASRSSRVMSPPPPMPHEHDVSSDANDADQSAAGETTEDNDADSDDTQPARRSVESSRAPGAPKQEPDVGEEEDGTEEEEERAEEEQEQDEEEDDMDAETRRRMELRERMAKMSGGMGMAGMFGPMPGMPGMAPPPQRKRSTRESAEAAEERVTSPASAPRIPMIPIPGMQTVRSPEVEDKQLADEDDQEEEEEEEAKAQEQRAGEAGSITSERGVAEPPHIQQERAELVPRASLDRAAPPVPQERPLSSPAERNLPPPVPGVRPSTGGRAAPPPPPPGALPRSPTAGSESDDEMSAHPFTTSIDTSLGSRPAPPPVPATSRPANARSPPAAAAAANKRASYFGSESSPVSPATPASADRRASRVVPPVPGSPPMSPAGRAPPPPPPTVAPPNQAPPVPRHVDDLAQGESEYEGDYDTDIASGVKHKDALKAHAREASLDDNSTTGTDVAPPAPNRQSIAPRTVPPPPPPPQERMSLDAPRAAPPPVPAASHDAGDVYQEEHDYTVPVRSMPPPPPVPQHAQHAQEQDEDDDDDLYSAPTQRPIDHPPPPPPHALDTVAPLPSQAPPLFSPTRTSTSMSRQSVDAPRQSMSARRSMDQQRPNDAYIATDVDLGETTQWWTVPDLPPPVFQNRNDVLVEMEESSTSRRGGKTTISKDVYVLFIDYSQTVITARFDSREPMDVSFEQRHEAPPGRPRQDQLEAFWQRYGARISDAAAAKKDTVVGDGSPGALVLELMRPLQGSLLPVGTRAYGALVYANLANASVQQFDEIRPGDIITLRNAKLAGKHGTMHQKYSMDVGMGSGHVAIVVDWDGTKKKVRAWEQGREKSKVKMESFRLSDLKSGEVRVWRVVPRSWVGWDSN